MYYYFFFYCNNIMVYTHYYIHYSSNCLNSIIYPLLEIVVTIGSFSDVSQLKIFVRNKKQNTLAHYY